MPHPKVKLADDSGNEVGVTDNRLNVNAHLAATPTIDIGDVSLLLDGTAADYGTGNVNTSGRTLRVTLASDDVHFGAVGASADADGALHAQLLFANTRLICIDDEITNADTNLGYLVGTIHGEDSQHDSADGGYMSLAVRNDDLAALGGTDGDYAPFQVNATGALYVTSGAGMGDAVSNDGITILGEAKIIDGSGLPNVVAEGSAGRIAISRSGIQYTHLTNDSGTDSAILEEDSAHTSGDYGIMALAVRNDTLAALAGTDGDYTPLQVNATGALYISGTVDLGSTATDHLSEIEGAVETIEGAVSGSEMQVDVVAALPGGDNNIGNVDIASSVTLSVNSHAVTNAGTFAVQVSDSSFAIADGNALGEGVLVQGDDGSDRKNIHVDASTGDVQVDVTNTVTVDGSGVTQPVSLASVPSHAVTNAGTFVVQEDGAALTALELLANAIYIDDADWTNSTSKHMLVGGLYQSSEQTVTDGDVAPIQVNDKGMVKVDINEVGGISGTHWFILPTGNAGSPAHLGTEGANSTDAGFLLMAECSDVLAATTGVTDGEYGHLQMDTQGALYTNHGITGGGDGTKVVLSAGSDLVLGGDVPCKKVDIQAQTDNTGIVAVGFTGVDATVATGTGVILNPGDVYSLEINNLNLIYIDAIVSGEGVRYTYFT